GEIFTIPVDKGDVRNLTNSSGSAERDPAWSPDGKFVSYFSDKSGEYKLVIEAQDGLTPPREITLAKPTHYYTPSWSPDSKKLLFTDTNLKVWVLDLATEQAKIVGEDPWMVPARTLNPVWSPDSKWVAYSSRLRSLYHAIFISNVETGERKQVTDGLADAVWPTWDANGKYLWFLASTDFGLRSQWLDMTSYDHETNFGLYFAVLRKSDPSPLLPESDEDRGVGTGTRRLQPGACPGDAAAAAEGGGGGEGGQRGPRGPVTVQIDFDGLSQRIVSVPGVPERQYADLQAGVDGQVFYLEAARGGGPSGGGNELWRYRLCDRRATSFVNNVAAYEISADHRKLVYRTAVGGGQFGGPGAGGGTPPPPQLFLVDADRTAPQPGAGRLNFTLRMYLEPKEEFKQIFNEGWRNQRDYLYVQNMHGADLNYLMDMMGAEIAIGHSYVRGGDMPTVPQPVAGLLGADFVIENGRYKVTRIYDNESWNPDLRSPLATPGANVNPGDYILAINGVELNAPDNIYRLLDGTANRQTTLTVNTTPTMQGARTVTVLPVANEQPLRTRAWVESNRRLVEKLSDGQLAYVYLPNTGQPGYTSFNRYYFSQQDKKGVVVDERFNGGGSAADYIIEVLARDFD